MVNMYLVTICMECSVKVQNAFLHHVINQSLGSKSDTQLLEIDPKLHLKLVTV